MLTGTSNAFIFPCVYFFYPETAGRSLEEMDAIFTKCKSIFTVVRLARDEPKRFGKHGEVLISYEQSAYRERRKSSLASAPKPEASRHEKEYA